MDLKETPVKKNYIYKGKILSLRCDDALLPDGRPCKREIVEHSGGACVLCVREGKVVFVRQFRYAYGETLLEIPAGKLAPQEDPMHAAKRELEEETGLVADLDPLAVLYPTPGYSNEKIYIYRAKNVREGERRPDDDEFLETAELPLEEALAMVKRGEIRDAKTIAALLLYAQS